MKPDGVYFNMPAEEYHKLERLSATGIKNMAVSPALFWHRSWLNPNYVDEDTPAKLLGRAYHTARLEPEKLNELFVQELDKQDYENFPTTDVQVKAELKKLGEPQTKTGETTTERAQRLRDAGAEYPIYALDLEKWSQEKGNRTPIPARYWKEMKTDMERFQNAKEVAELLTGGAAEVTILWTCEKTGIKMKCRIDYLRPELFTDLKTFQNGSGKHLDRAIADAFKYNQYHIQVALYWNAIELIRAGKVTQQDATSSTQIDLLDEIKKAPNPMDCWLIFQEKGGIPNLLAYKVEIGYVPVATQMNESSNLTDEQRNAARNATWDKTALMRKAEAQIEHAKNEFTLYQTVYPNGEPWEPVHPLREIDDELVGRFWLED